jgi:hypothetical protein
MSSNQPRRGRLTTSLLALAAVAAMTAAFAAPAGAVSGSGNAVIVTADHSKGRTLSGQGVKLLAGAGASAQGNKLTLPTAELNPGAQPSAHSSASLTFKRGKRAVALTGIHFNLSAGTLVGKLGETEIPVFWLGAAPKIDSTVGSISLSEGSLRLTAEAATALREELDLKRALVRKGVGMIWLAAQANPTHAAAQPVVSGSVDWGVLASWRKYVLTHQGPPPPTSIGAITVAGGATSTGTLTEPSAYFSFPVTGGSFEKGLYGASDKLSLTTQGSVKFEKPAHCIIEVGFSDIDLTIGTASTLSLDSVSDIDTPPTCTDNPPALAANVPFATLGAGSIAPTYSASGKTVTWSALPATLTAAGSAAWGAGPPYIAGKALDPVTITVGLG